MTWNNNKQQSKQNLNNNQVLKILCPISASHLRVHKRKDTY